MNPNVAPLAGTQFVRIVNVHDTSHPRLRLFLLLAMQRLLLTIAVLNEPGGTSLAAACDKKNADPSILGVLTFFICIYLHSLKHYSIVKQSCVGGEEAGKI